MKGLEVIDACCSPFREILDDEQAERLAASFRVLGDAARLRLLSLIAAQPGGESCVCELVEPLELSQPTVSHHLKVLHQAGILDRQRRGVWVYYRIVPETLEALKSALAA